MKTATALLPLAALSSVMATPLFGFFETDSMTMLRNNRGGGNRGDRGDRDDDRRGEGTIIDKLRHEKRYSKFVEVLQKERGLRDDLENRDKQTTVFAPTNEAFERLEEQLRNNGYGKGGDYEDEIRDIMRYHIVPDTYVKADKLYGGELLETDLKLRSLGNRHQRIRVFKFANTPLLNMQAHVVDQDIEAENGVIQGINNVLMPPKGVKEMLLAAPTEFSTFITACYKTNLKEEFERMDEKGVTVFAPDNSAWKSLGFMNLRYLFSCVGQKTDGREDRDRDDRRGDRDRDDRRGDRDRDDRRGRDRDENQEEYCRGTEDLKKIMKYHIAKKLAWSTDMMEKKEMKFDTLSGKELEMKVMPRGGHRGGHGDRDDDEDFDSYDRHRGGRDEDRDRELKHPSKYNFVLNQGEARVKLTDVLARNGAIQVINNVLIPEGVRLPYDIGFQQL